MITELTITVNTTGNHTDSELRDYLKFLLGQGGCSQDNPFISEAYDAEISYVEID